MADVRRILILGGGIGGLGAAAALRAVGLHPEVFEQSPALREVGAGVGLWSNAMASLDELGAGEEVRRRCRPLRVVAGGNPQGKTVTSIRLDDLGPDFAEAACFVAPRPALLAALARVVPADVVHTGRRATRVDDAPGGESVRVSFEDGAVEEGSLVVAADGLHSIARAPVAGKDAIRYSGQTCFRAIVARRALEPDTMREVQGRGERGSVCPIDEATSYWWVAYNAPPGRVVPVGERKATLIERYGKWPFGLGEAIAATPEEAILQNDLVDRPPARAYARGRVVLVGDAAHPTTPNLGQGANMAIDDAIALARALRDEPSIERALARYERERLPRTRLVVRRSWSFGRMTTWTSGAAVALREAMVRMTPPGVMRDMLRWQILETVGHL